MSLAALSLAALLIAILASTVTPLNVGVLALAFAWGIGLYGGIGLGYKLSATTTIDASYDFSKIDFFGNEFDVNMFSVGLTFSF